MDDFDIREQLSGNDWQRYPPHRTPELHALSPSPAASSFDVHDGGSSRCSRASFEEGLPEHPYVDGFSTYIHPGLRKHSKHAKSSSSGTHPERSTSRQAAHMRRSKSASNFASMFPSDEAPPPVPPLHIHTQSLNRRSPIVPALMLKGSYPAFGPDKGLNGKLPALPPDESYSYSPPPLPPKHPDLPKSSSAELVSINEAAAMAVRRRTRSGPQHLPLMTSYHGNLNRSVDAPPRLHTTKSNLPSPRQSHRRAHSAQHSSRDTKFIPDLALPTRSASRQSLKHNISSPTPVLPDKLMPSSYHAPYASLRAAPSPPLQVPATRRPPMSGLRTPPPPPDQATSLSSSSSPSGQRPLPPLPDFAVSQTTTAYAVATLPRSATMPILESVRTRTTSVLERHSILKNQKQGEEARQRSPGSLAKEQALAWRKAVRDEAVAAVHEAEAWAWPVPPLVPALERSSSRSTYSASPRKSLVELAGDWETAGACSLMIELDSGDHPIQRNNSSTFSSDLGPVTPDEHEDRNPFDAVHASHSTKTAPAPQSTSPRSVAHFGVPF